MVNPDEPAAGQYAFRLYDESHPVRGDSTTIKRFKKQLAGLRGERVTLRFSGLHVDGDTGKARRFRVQRTFNYRQYADVFGPSSAFADVLHYVKGRWSDEELVVDSFTVDVADDIDEDDEAED